MPSREHVVTDPTLSADAQVDRVTELSRGAVLYDEHRTVTRTVTADETIIDGEHTILIDASGGAVTLTLPLAASLPDHELRFKSLDSSGGTVTVQRTSPDTIDGATSFTLATNAGKTILSDGALWYIVSTV